MHRQWQQILGDKTVADPLALFLKRMIFQLFAAIFRSGFSDIKKFSLRFNDIADDLETEKNNLKIAHPSLNIIKQNF